MKANLRLFGLVAVVLMFAIALATFLNHNKFRRMLVEQEQSRAQVVGLDLVESIHRGFDLGISLGQMNYIEDILARVRAGDPRIDSVYVFNAGGKVLYQSGNLALQEMVPAWRDVWQSASGTWHAHTEVVFVVGFDLRNNFAQHVGGVTITYDRAITERRLARLMARQIVESAAIVMVSTLIGLLLIHTLMRQGLAPLRRILGDPTPGAGSDLGGAYASFQSNVGETVEALDELDRALSSLREPSR